MSTRNDAAPRLGGKLAIILFVFTLFAFVAESQLTQVNPLLSDGKRRSPHRTLELVRSNDTRIQTAILPIVCDVPS